jgi:hypothetical protein
MIRANLVILPMNREIDLTHTIIIWNKKQIPLPPQYNEPPTSTPLSHQRQ